MPRPQPSTRPDAAPAPTLLPVERSRLYERVVDRLLSHIVQAGLSPGDRLPSERELADRLGVSRTSVRQALVALRVQGVIDVRHGRGSFLRQVDVHGSAFHRLADRRRRLREVLEAREALEVKISELAAARRLDGDLERMQDALALMEREISQGRIPMEGDAAFHRALARAAHNEVLGELMERLQRDIEETRFESLSQPGRPLRSLAGHRAILAAVREGDPGAAGRAMREHLAVVSDVALMRWEPRG